MHSGRDLLCMPRQILEESFTALQVKEEALSKKEEDVSALQRQTEALLNTLPPKGLMRCMTPLPQGPMAKMRVI